MLGWHHQLNGHEFEAPGVGDGQGGLACCSPWGCKESDMTEQLNSNNAIKLLEHRKVQKDERETSAMRNSLVNYSFLLLELLGFGMGWAPLTKQLVNACPIVCSGVEKVGGAPD